MSNTPARSVIHCAKCGQPSYLRVIVPSSDKPGYDERLFECESCKHAETLFVKIEKK
jgi:hypothetical protein